MHEQVNRTIKISIDVIIVSLIITLVASFSYLSHRGYRNKLDNIESRELIRAKLHFYRFDDRIVSGSDIVDVILGNVRLYSFEIRTRNGTFVISHANENTLDGNGVMYGLRLWSMEYIAGVVLGGNIFYEFHASLIRDQYSGEVKGVRFIQRGS